MQIFFIKKKKSTSYHDADDPRNGEGMGGDWKRDTFQTPNIPPYPPTQCVWGGGGGQEEDTFSKKQIKIKKKKKKIRTHFSLSSLLLKTIP